MNTAPSHWQVSGRDQAPWLTLAHPIGADKSIWDSLLPWLEPHFRVLRYDARGHGQAPVPTGPLSFADLAQDCLDLWDRLGMARSHFVGLSMGGCTGVALALAAPQRVVSLTVACSRLEVDEAASAMWHQRAALAREQGMVPLVESTLARWLSEAWRSAHPDAVERVRAMLLGTSPAGFAACAQALAQGHSLADLSALALPVLYIAGREDQAVAPAHLARYQAHTPGSRLAEVAGPHILHLENLAGFAQTVLGFLKQAPGTDHMV